MTEDHFPPDSDHLPGDDDIYPELCPHCDRHVMSNHDHDEDCPEWRGNQEDET